MSRPSERLARLGVTLPAAPRPVASYVPGVRCGRMLYVSGQIPFVRGELLATGIVGHSVDEETARACARQCAVNALAVVAAEVGSVDRVARVVRVGCFVACAPDFEAHPSIANGASELMQEVFGENGRHARAAVGVASLPLGAPVEVEFLFELTD